MTVRDGVAVAREILDLESTVRPRGPELVGPLRERIPRHLRSKGRKFERDAARRHRTRVKAGRTLRAFAAPREVRRSW